MEASIPDGVSLGDLFSLIGWPLLVMLAGGVLAFVSGLWMLVVAFKESILWGVCVLLVPFAGLVFLFVKWSVAKNPFLLSLFAFGLMVGGTFLASGRMSPENPEMIQLMDKVGPGLADQLGGMEGFGGEPGPTPVRVVGAEELRAIQRELNRESAVLMERKANLDSEDRQAKVRLTREILDYNRRLEEFRELREAMGGAGSGEAGQAEEVTEPVPAP